MQWSVHYNWKKSVNQSLLDLHKLATEKNDPHWCDFIETHYLHEQVKSIRGWGDRVASSCSWGPLNLTRKSISLTNTSWETALDWIPTVMG